MSKSLVIRERYERTCDSYDELYRGEQYAKYYVALRAVKPRGVVLDAGCGTALLAEFLRAWRLLEDLEAYICLDYSNCMLGIARWKLEVLCDGRCHVVLGDVENIPLKNSTVDITYSFTVLDLVDNPLKTLKELARVTREDIVVSVMRNLNLKDTLKNMGLKTIGATDKDVIFHVKPEELENMLEAFPR
ncbi:MAG: class I SAM-dependent methyltransferase [Acidilobaceae archaeon]